jgi:hypothetical protein
MTHSTKTFIRPQVAATPPTADRNLCADGTENPPPAARSAPHALPIEAAPKETSPKATARQRRPGAPDHNESALKTGRRSPGRPPRGSKVHRKLKHPSRLANARLRRVEAELRAKIGGRPTTEAEDQLLRQVFLHELADRICGKLLKDMADLQGNELTLDQFKSLEKDQHAAAERVAKCLAQLGLGPSSMMEQPAGSDAAAFYRSLRNTPARAAAIVPIGEPPASDNGQLREVSP